MSTSKATLQKHIENYDNIKLLQSYRGIAVVLLVTLLGLGGLNGLKSGDADQFILSLVGVLVLSPILYSIYKGKKWAMITMIILLVLNQLFTLIQGSYAGIAFTIGLIFLLAQSIQVEKGRRKYNV